MDHDRESDKIDVELIRGIAEELDSNLHESTFLETSHDEALKPDYIECTSAQTRHVFFGNTERSENVEFLGFRIDKKLFSSKLGYSSMEFPRITIYNGQQARCSDWQN